MRINDPDIENDKSDIDMDAFSAAITGAEDTKPTEDKVDPEDVPQPVADLPDETADPNDPKLANDPAAELALKDKAKPEEVVDPAKQEPPKDEAIEKEISDLKLSEKSAERFREFAIERRDFAPIREAMGKAGIKTAEDLQGVIYGAQMGRDMVDMVKATGATSEQYSGTLDYLDLINKATKGDMQAAEKAYEFALKELQPLAAMLGKDIGGAMDPLAAHPDLLQAVENGDTTRALALEAVRGRTQTRMADGRSRQQQEQQVAQQRQEQAQQAQAAGIQVLQRLDAEFKADPAYATQKRPILNAMVQDIRAAYPPDQWEQRTRAAYATLAHIQPPAKPPTPGPVRSGSPGGNMVPQVFDDPMAALEAGIDAVR